MLNRKSIKTQFIVIFTAIILTSIIATIVTYFVGFIIFTSIEYKKIYPANYYEKKIPDIENYIRRKGESLLNIKEKSNIEKIIPSQGITYQIIDQNGDILYGTESQKFLNNKEDLYKKINTNQGLNGRYVHIVPIIDKHGKIAGAVLLYYKLVPYYQSTAIKLIFTVILLSPFLYIIFFAILFSKKFVRDIKKPIDMLIEASEKIKQKNLDFNIDYKAKNEFGSLCEAFDDMKNELKRSLISQWRLEQQRHDMVEALAHDLKTPLSIIQGYTESLLESNLNDKEKLERYLNVIKNSTFRALQMIKEMLYTAEIESYNLSLEVVPIDINSFIQQKVESYKIISKSKNIDFKVKIFDVMPDRKTCYCDKNKLERILDNIVLNSIRYTHYNGVININIDIREEKINFTICDTGKGFSNKDLANLFNKFYKGDEARSTKEGHIGLGLYTAKKLVELHGGTIKAYNSEKGGACISFNITNYFKE